MKTSNRNFKRAAVPLSALALAISAAVHAEPPYKEASDQATAQHDWEKLREKVINANEIMGGDVTNGLSTYGDVRDLILSRDSQRVEYILYEVPYPYSFYGSEDGFIRFDNAAFDTAGAFDLRVRIDDEESKFAAEELTLTRGQADHRLVSNIIGEPLGFTSEPGAFKEVENLLIDRDSGQVTHYVIEMNDESLFNSEPRAIPAARVNVDGQGRLSTMIALDQVSEMEVYQPDFL